MSNDFNFRDGNPYQAPQTPNWNPPGSSPPFSKGKVTAPAIALIVVGALGLMCSLFNLGHALIAEAEVDPAAPEFVQQMQKSSVGPVAATIQSVFILVNGVIIFGAVQMMRMASWSMGLTSTILAMINLGTCCCIIGLPIGVWSLVILMQADVKDAFAREQAGQFPS